MANKWMKALRQYEDSVDFEYDSFAKENCLYTPSPYFNWIFANKSMGIPKNASVLYYSKPKAGKSLSIYAQILQIQREDRAAGLGPDERRHCIVFNTELRGQLQHDVFPEIEKDYMTIYDTNNPAEVFDRVEKDIKPMVQDGLPLAMIAIDSLTNIMGVKRDNAESVTDHLVGDHALTVSIGLIKLIPFCKRNKIQLVATSQMRGNVDAVNKYAPKEKMAESWAAQHGFEYFVALSKASNTDEGKHAIQETSLNDDETLDAKGESLNTGHRIFVKMEASSIGPNGRAGIFYMDYKKGIIHQNEEVFWLGKNTGVIQLEGTKNYKFKDRKFNGKKECALAIGEDQELYNAILKEVGNLEK